MFPPIHELTGNICSVSLLRIGQCNPESIWLLFGLAQRNSSLVGFACERRQQVGMYMAANVLLAAFSAVASIKATPRTASAEG